MKALSTAALLTLWISAPAGADTIFRIEPRRDYREYRNNELTQRIWELERAVWQLQQRVFQLEAGSTPKKQWTCSIRSFGDTFIHTSGTRAEAAAVVQKQCGDKTSSIHCGDEKLKCSDE